MPGEGLSRWDTAACKANTPADFARFIEAETAKWAQVLKVSGAKID